MHDRESFENAIRDSPDDDTLRLVYADWLDENGDPDRAEFIRLQVDIQKRRISSGFDGVWIADLLARERELLIAHEYTWRRAGQCPRCAGKRVITERWRIAEMDADEYGTSTATCGGCNGTGDRGGLLWKFDYPTTHPPIGAVRTEFVRILEWRAGFPHVLAVPTLHVLVRTYEREVEQSSGGTHIFTINEPTPWLLSVVRNHPVTGVVPLDREPHSIPECVRPKEIYPTREAAITALGRAVVTWASSQESNKLLRLRATRELRST